MVTCKRNPHIDTDCCALLFKIIMDLIVKLITGRPLITCLVIGVFVMSMWWMKFQKQLNMKWYWAPILSTGHFIFSLIFIKFWALLEVGFVAEEAANMRLYGAIFFLPIVYYVGAKLTKRDVSLVMDMLSVCAAIGLLLVRVNCLITGCCDGICITPETTVRWPLVEMEMVVCILVIFYYWQRVYKRNTNGTAYPFTILVYSIFRFIIEWVREEYTGQIWIFHLAHIWALIAIIGSVIAIYLIKKHNAQAAKPHVKNKAFKKGIK